MLTNKIYENKKLREENEKYVEYYRNQTAKVSPFSIKDN